VYLSLMAFFLNTISQKSKALASDLQHKTPAECSIIDGCVCFAPIALDAIATEMVELRKCRIALDEKQRLINERFITFDSNHGIAWWQEPTVIAGGLVISFSLASLLTFWAVQDK